MSLVKKLPLALSSIFATYIYDEYIAWAIGKVRGDIIL